MEPTGAETSTQTSSQTSSETSSDTSSETSGAARGAILGEQHFRTLFGRAPIGIALVATRERRILDANAAYARIVGRSIEELRGMDWATITHPDDLGSSLADAARWLAEAQQETGQILKRYIRPDGSVVVVSMKSAALQAEGDAAGGAEPMHLSMIEDVTERTLAAARLADSERRYKLLTDHAGDIVMLVRDGIIEWITPSVGEQLGHDPESLYGKPTLDIIHPDEAEIVRQHRARLNAGQPVRVRARMRHTDGRWVWMECSSRPLLNDDGSLEGSAVSTMWNIQAEMEAREALAAAEAERRELEASIQRAARLESLGVLAGGVAHDFNNILVGILGKTELALAQVPSDSPLRTLLHQVATSAVRASDLTRQLLDYAGHRPFDHRGPVDPVRVVRDTMELVAPLLPRGAFVEVDLPEQLPPLPCDRGQLQQVVMNLVVNAADALESRPGRVRVRARVRHLDRSDTTRLAPANPPEPGDFVEISVQDDGVGMDESTASRAFEPFFTTKPDGRGLGLAAVYGIARSNRGAVEIRSERGRGTTARVLLPTVQGELGTVGEPPEHDASEPAAGEGTPEIVRVEKDAHRIDPTAVTVLLVDDDDDVRDVCELMLRSSGMQVVSCASGPAAVSHITEQPHRFDVVLLDMSMPEMGGEAVLRALRSVRPDLPAVLMSGFSAVNLHAVLADLAVEGFVQKPFRPDQVVSAVRIAAGKPQRG